MSDAKGLSTFNEQQRQARQCTAPFRPRHASKRHQRRTKADFHDDPELIIDFGVDTELEAVDSARIWARAPVHPPNEPLWLRASGTLNL